MRRFSKAVAFLGVLATGLTSGCASNHTVAPIVVHLAPSTPQSIQQAQSIPIIASVTPDPSNQGVRWSLSGVGSLGNQTIGSVTYNAPPNVPSSQQAMVTATSIADSSKTATLQITVTPPRNPVAFISEPLRPASVLPGAAGFALTVNGTGFLSGATVDLNSAALQTSFVNSHQLTAMVPSGKIATAGTASITVVNSVGGVRSNVVLLPVTTPEAVVNFTIAPGSPFPMGINTVSVVTGDFNGDGKTDLAISNDFTSGTVNVLLGNGDGTFTPATGSPVSVGMGPNWLIVGDFNGDGKPDLAVVEPLINEVMILLGKGDGTFAPAPGASIPVGHNPQVVATGDFNGDGKLDLAVTNAFDNNVSILLGNGDGTFTQAPGSPILVGNQPGSVKVGDLNGDGTLDLVVVNSNNSVTILLGIGDGTFTQAPGSPIPVGNLPDYLVIADFNGDGKLDLALTNALSSSVSILVGNGDGTFVSASGSPIQVPVQPTVLMTGDFNGDGKLDLVVGSESPPVITILLGNGDGTFSTGASLPTLGNDYAAFGDFNGDGRLDLVLVDGFHNTVTIYVQH